MLKLLRDENPHLRFIEILHGLSPYANYTEPPLLVGES
jgi:hypothetical protein